METLIGIFASPGEYAERLAAYINSRRDVGYGGICFHDNSELEEFFRSGEMSILLTDDPNHLKIYNSRTRVCFLCDDKEKAENENEEIHFKFLRASALLQHVLPSLKNGFVKNNIRTVFSPSSNVAARAGAAKLAEELAEQGRTLLINWDPFGAFGRNEEGGVSLSELLFAARKNRKCFGKVLERLRTVNGVSSFRGTDFYSDLWQFSPEEMTDLVEMCKTEGDFTNVVFQCAFMSEAIQRLMEMSDEILLPKAEEDDPGPEEFLRQMKYAGKQGILSKVRGNAE